MALVIRRLLAAAASILLLTQTGRAAELSIVGAWTLNKDLRSEEHTSELQSH